MTKYSLNIPCTCGYRLALPGGAILLALSPWATAAAVYGFFAGFRRKIDLAFSLLTVFFLSVEYYQIMTGGVMSYARYTLTLGTLAAAFAGLGFDELFNFLRMSRRYAAEISLAVAMILNLCLIQTLSRSSRPIGDKLKSIAPVLHFRQYLEDAGNYLRYHRKSTDKVVIDNYNYEPNQLAAVAGFPLIPDDREFLVPDLTYPELRLRMLAELPTFMRIKRPKYLVYAAGGGVKDYLKLPERCSSEAVSFEDMGFSCIFENQTYRIFVISYR